jgi:hypothetical protein
MPEIIDLLGGAHRIKTRVRGFAPWQPRAATKALLEQVQAVLAEYAEFLPLTVRQIYYRLVGAHDYEKTDEAYRRLGEHLTRARRARLIPMTAIRDDGGARHGGTGWTDAAAFLEHIRRMAAGYRQDRTAGQPVRLMVLCEAAGMVPQLGRITDPFDIAVISSGGFESVAEQYALAREIAGEDRPVEILHIGDHDPSGAHLILSLMENIEAFVRELGGEVRFTRLAVTPEQITQFALPTAPPKPTDNRAFAGQTCQVEALPPDILANILRSAIAMRLDFSAYERVLEQEETARRRLVAMIAAGLPEEG